MTLRAYSLLMTIFLTAGCTNSSPPAQPPLAERLAGKSPVDRQEILGLACLNEAEKMSSSWRRSAHGVVLMAEPQLDETKAICLQMTVAYLSSDAKKHALLAQRCKNRVLSAMHSDNSGAVEHAPALQEICEKMTGQKISYDGQ